MISQPTQQNYYDFGFKNIGPLLDEYCRNLHYLLESCGLTNILFCARAGLRIAECLRYWLKANDIVPSYKIKVVPLSRIAALRLCKLDSDSDFYFIEEAMFANTNLRGIDAVNKFLLSEIQASDIPEGLLDFKDILKHLRSSEAYKSVFRVIADSRHDFSLFLKELDLNENCVIVDTGWAGSTQLFLEKAYPQIDFLGFYFATSQKTCIAGSSPGKMLGILHNHEHIQPFNTSADIIHHRHFFESLFEPNIASYGLFSLENVELLNSSSPQSFEVHKDWDHVYLGAVGYINECRLDPDDRHDNFIKSAAFVCEEFCRPSSLLNVFSLGGKGRSHDMGRDGVVEIFDIDDIRKKLNDKNYEFNLWPEGTAYLVSTMYNEDSEGSPFTLLASPQAKSIDSVKMSQDAPLVSIITRTKDRPVLLRRALKSVAAQDYKYIEHIIVNDGGSPLVVENEILSSDCLSSNLKVLHNKTSLGMEAASNAGISHSKGKFLLIHDDDDSLKPNFVSECINYLSNNSSCSAVVTRSIYVSEQINGNTVQILGEYPYNSWLEYVMMSEMAVNNIFPPISFIFSREIYDEIGGFNESLPVLGDWDFNLKFLALADIGVIPEELAYYHHRDQGNTASSYSNSVIGGIDKHKKYRPIMINGILRSDSEKLSGLRSCIANAYSMLELRSFTRK